MARQRGIPAEHLELLRGLVEEVLEQGDAVSARELAEQMGLDAAVLSRFRRGQGLEFDNLTRMARYFGYADAVTLLAAHHPARPNRPICETAGFDAAFAEARKLYGSHFNEQIWRLVPTVSWATGTSNVTPLLLFKLAEALSLEARTRESGTMQLPPKALAARGSSKKQ